MSLTATVGKERDLIEEGIFDGVCSKIIDLGTQYSEIFKNSAHKIRIFWEIVGETIEINGEQMPRLVSKEFTLSLNEKSKLRQALQSWRGKAFTAEELQGFDLKKVLGVGLSLIHIWQWCSPRPESIIRGGTGRIRTFNTEDYTHAEVTVGEYFKIAFKMMKIVDFSAAANPCPDDAADTEPTDEAEPKVVDPAVWYDLVGREVLTGLIRDWSTRGHSMLYIAEDGKVFFTEGADEIQAEELKEFPTKQYWPELAKCLEKDDLKTQLQENRMDVLWN